MANKRQRNSKEPTSKVGVRKSRIRKRYRLPGEWLGCGSVDAPARVRRILLSDVKR
jgi:hypothetical protein